MTVVRTYAVPSQTECDGPGRTNVHGARTAPKAGKTKGKKIYLSECAGCYDTMYCSKECQNAAWSDHKASCKEAQRKRKEDEDKRNTKTKKTRTNGMQKQSSKRRKESMQCWLPLCLLRSTGSKKKKGKKSGGKKKKGKKYTLDWCILQLHIYRLVIFMILYSDVRPL